MMRQVNIHTDTLNESGFVESKSHIGRLLRAPFPIPLQQQSLRSADVPSIHTIPKEQVKKCDFKQFPSLIVI
jgi:hypothetical protein